MGITFKRAPTVEIGQRTTSTQINALAQAFNDRIVSGLGDATWRMWWKAYSMFGRFRTDDGLGGTPAVDEWFATYMLLRPEDGAPDGTVNHGNPMASFPLGAGAVGDEGTRLNIVPASEPVTLAAKWALAKTQRGVVDPIAQVHNAPAIEASEAHKGLYYADSVAAGGVLVTGDWSNPFNKTYGGFRGVPDQVDCGGSPSSVRSWTHLRTGAVVNYATCSIAADYLTGVEYGPDEYILSFHVAAAVVLRYADYIEGPYVSGTYLRKHNVDVFSEVICRYVSGFRGADAQRAGEDWQIERIGFDFERFFTTQYRLAPAHGTQQMDLSILADGYPRWSGEDTTPGSHVFRQVGGVITGDVQYAVPTGFCVAGIYVQKSVVTGPAEVLEMDYTDEDGNPAFKLISLPAGQQYFIIWFEEVVGGLVSFSNPEDATSDLIGQWDIEAAVLQIYKPDLTDAYTVLRRGTTTGAASIDTRGSEFTGAKDKSDAYFADGCISAGDALDALGTDDQVNESPVYDAARALMRDHLRLLKREHLSSYAVENGVSVLYFNRTATLGGVTLDLWQGIGPPNAAITSGKILSGVEYVVKGTGWVTYDEMTYYVGAHFTGVDLETDFEVTGTAAVWQVEGILSDAPAQGFSNEWTMFLETCGYGGASYDPDDVADVIAFMHNRCQAFSQRLRDDVELGRHIAYGQVLPVITESPSGLTYVSGMNGTSTDEFYKSCQVYKADYRVVSVKDAGGGLVRVQFDRQFDNDGGAMLSWRTDENSITDYLAAPVSGGAGAECPQRIGDWAVDALDSTTHGACIPRFHFTKLAEYVHEDDPPNEEWDETDTRRWADRMQWMHWAMEAMCDAYVDTAALGETGCVHLPQFTFNLLCYRAGVRAQWLRLLPERIRDEVAKGFGPFPNCRSYVEYFNALSDGVNLLTRLPLDLPIDLEARRRTTGGRMTAPVTDTSPGAQGTGQVMAVVGSPSATLREDVADPYPWEGAYTGAWSAWSGAGTFSAAKTASSVSTVDWRGVDGYFHSSGIEVVNYNIVGNCFDRYWPRSATDINVHPPPWNLLCHQDHVEIRISQTSHPHLAVRAEILDLISASGGMAFFVTDSWQWETLDGTGSVPVCAASSWHDSSIKTKAYSVTKSRCAIAPVDGAFVSGGSIEVVPPPAQPSVLWAFVDGQCGTGSGSCANAVYSDRSVNAVGYLLFDVPLA